MTAAETYGTLMDAFQADADARMRALRDARVVLETAPEDGDAWDQVRRAAHTIAGNAGMMGFDGLAAAARNMEHRVVTVMERGATPDDVWSIDGEREALECLLLATMDSARRSGAGA